MATLSIVASAPGGTLPLIVTTTLAPGAMGVDEVQTTSFVAAVGHPGPVIASTTSGAGTRSVIV